MKLLNRSRRRILLSGLVFVVGGWLAVTASVPTAFLLGVLLGAGVIVYRPMLGVLFFAVTIPVENLVMFGDSTLTRLMGMGVFAGWGVHKILYGESWRTLFQNPLMLPATLLIALAALSMLWAREPGITLAGTFQLLQMFALTLLLLDLLNAWTRVEQFVRVLVIGALTASAVTLFQFYVSGLDRAGSQVGGGVNETSLMLLTLLPFAFYMLRSSQSAIWRLLGRISMVAGVGAIVVTFSRMSLLLLPPLLLTQYWETLRHRRGSGWLAVTTAGIVIVAMLNVPWSLVERRASTILPYIEATMGDGAGSGSEEGEMSARGYHLLIGLEIFADHPVLGVGYGNYGDYFLHDYQFQVEGMSKLFKSRRSPHSSNIGILADLGLVGLALWLYLLGVGLYAVFRAWRSMRGRGHGSDGFFLVQAVAYSYVLHAAAYTWYVPSQELKLFWIILSLTVVTHGLAMRTVGARGSGREAPFVGSSPARTGSYAQIPTYG